MIQIWQEPSECGPSNLVVLDLSYWPPLWLHPCWEVEWPVYLLMGKYHHGTTWQSDPSLDGVQHPFSNAFSCWWYGKIRNPEDQNGFGKQLSALKASNLYLYDKHESMRYAFESMSSWERRKMQCPFPRFSFHNCSRSTLTHPFWV